METTVETAGKVVLITGGSRGIGLGTAMVMARQGWSVAITGTNEANLKTAEAALTGVTKNCLAIRHRVEDTAGWAELIDKTCRRFDRLDAMIGNAGVSLRKDGKPYPFEETPADIWRQTLDINVTGVVHGFQAAIPKLKQAGGGSLVAVSSVAGKLHVRGASAHYSSSKAALVSIVRVAAWELGRHGIRVNAVAPGRINTDMARAFAAASGKPPDTSDIALNRLGEPEEVGEAIAFLCSPAASYITGACLDIGGGWNMI